MIRKVGPTVIRDRHKATCHCGAVELELSLPDGIVNPRRCDCSMCRRRGAIVASVPLAGIRVVKGQDVLKLYQFNTRTARHYFCSSCGIYTHHQRRSAPHPVDRHRRFGTRRRKLVGDSVRHPLE